MTTIAHSYDTHDQALRVVADLEDAGFTSKEVGIITRQYADESVNDDSSATGAGVGIGTTVGGGIGLLAGLGLMAIPGLGPVVAAGWIASTALGAASGFAVGGVIGGLIDLGTPDEDAHVYAESLRRGGTLVTVTTDEMRAARASEIMRRYDPIDPAVRRAEYQKEGWTTFDPDAPMIANPTPRTENPDPAHPSNADRRSSV
ncbi:MAG: hypothetical protein R3D57_02695 [Hyphomicrobiaceae bacterium]